MWLVVRPFVFLWAGLQLIDSIGFGTRVARLVVGTALHRLRNKNDGSNSQDDGGDELCSVCDDVMGDLLAGNDGLSAIPCKWACLKIKSCVSMCEKVQEASATSIEFPCVAAGFCRKNPESDADEIGEDLLTTCQGQRGILFQCKPRRYCHRVRRGLKFPCELRPGIKRWTGMKQLATQHTAALAAGLLSQKHCSEPDAGPYCIARPQGFSLFSDILGNIIALLIGGYKSIVAIESPGGSDDRQWLTFWLVLSILLFLENNFARVLLSSCPFYFEIKLLALIWLIWYEGADRCYRRLKRFLISLNWIIQYHGTGTMAQEELNRFHSLLGEKLLQEIQRIQGLPRPTADRESVVDSSEAKKNWAYDPNAAISAEVQALRHLFELSMFLLSAEGANLLANSSDDVIRKDIVSFVLERAAACASFQPRFMHISLVGSIPGAAGEVPSMDRNGLADPYVVFHLIPPNGGAPYPTKGVLSTICYKTLSPQWNQRLEIPLRGGQQDEGGYFQSQTVVGSTQLLISVYDADVGLWSVIHHFFKVLAPISCFFLWALPKLPKTISWWTKETHQTLPWMMFSVALTGYVVSYILAVVKRSDDEPIGECVLPLGILMDQGEHSLLLTLRPPNALKEISSSVRQNTVGGYGVIRVKLCLSEN